MSIKKVAHISDIHLRKSPTRHLEYREVFSRLEKSLRENKPDRIVVVGDLQHDYIDMQGEQIILAGEFLNMLASIAKTIIVRGNHDILKKSLKRTDSIDALVSVINNPNIVYYNETGIFEDENVNWAVWKHGEKKNNPWELDLDYKLENTTIDLFHDPVNGAVSPTGHIVDSKIYRSIKDFKGDLSFFGDYHKMQYLDTKKRKAYSGSLIAQDFGEGDNEFHGYLFWNIEKKTATEISIENNYSFKTVGVNMFTDFDNLEIEIENPTEHHMRLRVLWRTEPEKHTIENERKVKDYLLKTYAPISISHKANYIVDEKMEIDSELTVENILDVPVQQKIFREHLTRIGTNEDDIEEIIKLDDQITSRISAEEFTNIQWSIEKFWGINFMSYEDIEIDWRDKDGLFQITGLNTAGKTTIMKLISYILYNKTLETEKRQKFGDYRFLNNKNGATFCEGGLVLSVNGQYYGIKRRTDIKKNKEGEIRDCTTEISYYLLSSIDSKFDDSFSIETLDTDRKSKTEKIIQKVIGTFENFNRVVMTTSDTLNNILSSDESVFIDSILFDSGLDIFDLKLKAFKNYKKDMFSVNRINCDLQSVTQQNENLNKEIDELNELIVHTNTVLIPEVTERIKKGDDYCAQLNRMIHKIDPELQLLDSQALTKELLTYPEKLKEYEYEFTKIQSSISMLKKEYDSKRLESLMLKKDENKNTHYTLNTKIKELNSTIDLKKNNIERINGEIILIKKTIGRYENEVVQLKNSKICPTCGQPVQVDKQSHIQNKIESINNEIAGLNNDIKEKEKSKTPIENEISESINQINKIKIQIDENSLMMEKELKEIGIITNDKNEVERREKLMFELSTIPTKMDNIKLTYENKKRVLKDYNDLQDKIIENKKIDATLEKAKERLNILKNEYHTLITDIENYKSRIGNKKQTIATNNDLMAKFEMQEKRDYVFKVYEECIHRDGIPTYLLKNMAIPKINIELGKLFEELNFKVWFDLSDLKLKMAYNTSPNSVINAISGSGKERTFASICLKFALNQINAKSKPSIFLLDEIMGKLTDDSVTEFIDILHKIKEKTKKLLVVEHKYEISPDHIIEVTKDDRGISKLEII